jgi:hypothetical protein
VQHLADRLSAVVSSLTDDEPGLARASVGVHRDPAQAGSDRATLEDHVIAVAQTTDELATELPPPKNALEQDAPTWPTMGCRSVATAP